MAKVPGAVPVKSRLHASLGATRATDLYGCFLLDRLDAVASLSGIAPFVAFTPGDAGDRMRALAPASFRCVAQPELGLGERLVTLLDARLADGHRGAIAMDSDSPTLPMSYVIEAARVLDARTADVAIGPCDDGGYYLIGVRVPQPRLFEDIPWSTDAVLARTLERAKELRLRVHILPAWFDVDTEADLKRLHDEMTASEASAPTRSRAFVAALYGERR